MKIVLIGAGSFVFAPTVLCDAIETHRLDELALVLVDLNREAAETMGAFGRRMAADLNVTCRITAAVQRTEVLPGADFVILSASPEGMRRWRIDYDILTRHQLAAQSRECGGLGGLANSLRSITLALAVARDMERLCPGATLLDVTNPMPRVVTAVHRFTAIPVFGFCNVAWSGPAGYRRFAQLVGRTEAEIEVVTAGLNHFAWLLSIRDRRTGADLYPQLKEAVHRAETREMRVFRRWLDAYGLVAAGGADHHGEYLPPQPDLHYRTRPPYHGDEAERAARWQMLREAGAGRADWRAICSQGSWEHPLDLAVALQRGERRSLDMLNLPNAGYLPQLPAGRIVEVPVLIDGGRVAGISGLTFPEPLAELLNVLSDVHELVAQGAAEGRADLLAAAIERDPAVPDKAAGIAVLQEMLATHRDMLPQFG